MDHSDNQKESARPTPNRGPLKFVDNGTGKKRTRFFGRGFEVGALFRRQKEGNSPAAMHKTAKVDSRGKAAVQQKPKAAGSVDVASKPSPKAGDVSSFSKAGQTTASTAVGGERQGPTRGNMAGWACITLALIVAIGLVAYTNIKARGDKIVDLFPDQSLQEYIAENVDSNGDGRLSEEEILNVYELDGFQGRDIRSLAGLEMFSNLERLDASGAGAEEIFRVHRHQWSLFGETTKKEIRTHFLENLTSLNLSDNNLSGELDFRDSCPNLVDLNISNNNLEGLELASGATIETFDCSNNAFEGRLAIKPGIKNLNCAGNQLVQIVITSDLFESNGPLDSLYCQDNQLVSMLDGNNPFPYDITVVSKDKVDISNNPGIWIDNVRENGVVEIGYAKLNP